MMYVVTRPRFTVRYLQINKHFVCLFSFPFASEHSALLKSSRSALGPAPASLQALAIPVFKDRLLFRHPRNYPVRLSLASTTLSLPSSKSNVIRVERRATTLTDVTPVTWGFCPLTGISRIQFDDIKDETIQLTASRGKKVGSRPNF